MRSRRLLSLGFVLFTAASTPFSAIAADTPPTGAAPAAPQATPPTQPPAASPQGAAAPTDPASGTPGDRAAQFYQEGNALYDQGKYKEAEAKYQAAWDIQQSFDVAGNLGNVEMLVGQPRDAAEHLSYALRTFPLGGTPQKKKFLQDRLAEAKQQIGTLQVVVNVDRAQVLIDGKKVGESPVENEIFVVPGERTLVVQRGRLKATKSLLVAKGSSQKVAVTLEAGPKKEILIAGAAVGGAGLVSGLVFTLLANGKSSDAEALRGGLAAGPGGRDACDRAENQTRCGELDGLVSDQGLFANVAFWSFVGGGVALAGTGVYWLVTSSEPAPAPRKGFRATPLVTAKGGGLLLQGDF